MTYASRVASGEELRGNGGQWIVRGIGIDQGRAGGNEARLLLHNDMLQTAPTQGGDLINGRHRGHGNEVWGLSRKLVERYISGGLQGAF